MEFTSKESYLGANGIERYLATEARILPPEQRIKERLHSRIKASVVIPAFQESKNIQNTLMSLNEQRADPLEVVVVDNGSTDKTRDVVLEFQKHNLRYPLYLLEEPLPGPGNARKTGMDEVVRRVFEQRLEGSNHILVTTDADAVFSPGWIRSISNLISQGNGAVGGPHSGLPWIDAEIATKVGVKDYFLTLAKLNRGVVRSGIGKIKMSGPNVAFIVKSYVEAGGIRQPYDISGNIALKEIADIADRIEQRGYSIAQIDDIVYSSRRRHFMQIIKRRAMYYSGSSQNHQRFLPVRGSESILLDYAIRTVRKGEWEFYQQLLVNIIVMNTVITPFLRGKLDYSNIERIATSSEINELLSLSQNPKDLQKAIETEDSVITTLSKRIKQSLLI